MNRYVFDKKLNKSWIESDNMKCDSCKKSFINGDSCFLGIRTKRIRCQKCANKNNSISSDILLGDVEWRPGNIKEVKKHDETK
jgi:hypothetical protein